MGASSTTAFQCSPRWTTIAASAPAAPATMKLDALQRKSSRQVAMNVRLVDKEIAAATRLVLTRKYAAIAMTSGLPNTAVTSVGEAWPPSPVYTAPVATIVIA